MRLFATTLLAWLVVNLTLAQVPSVKAGSLQATSTFCSQITMSWTNGDGVARLVVISEGSSLTSLPASNTPYRGDSRYGYGSMLGTGQYVVYNGTLNSVVIENLRKNTTYYISVFEYNGGGVLYQYKVDDYPEVSVKTKNITSDFSIDDSYQCENVNLSNFTSSATQDASSALNYNWSFGDGNTASTANASHSYDTYKIYEVSLEVSSYRCKDTMVKEDTVAPLPEFNFVLTADSVLKGYTQQQCFYKPDGSENYFHFNTSWEFKPLIGVSGSPLIDEFELYWTFGDGGSETNQIRVHKTYDEPGVYPVKLILRSTQNRIEYCLDSVIMQVEVFPSPIDSSLLVYDTLMCMKNNSFLFEHNSTNSQLVHSWDFGDGNTSGDSSSNHSYASAGEYEFELEVTDQNACYAQYKDTVVVIPQPNNTISGLDSRYCEGDDPVQLTTSMAGGTWISSKININTGTFDPTTLGENVVQYVVDVDGCKDTAEVTTRVFPLPVFDMLDDTTVCVGESIRLEVTKDTASILWSTGAMDSFINVSTGGEVWVEKRVNGCSHRETINVNQITAPYVNLGSDSLLCGDGVVYVNIGAAEGVYVWNDGYSGGGVREITESGTYSVTATNKCGSASDEVTLEFLPYVCDIFIPSAFSPNGDGLNDIFQPSGNVDITSMEVYSRWGELLYSSDNSADGFGWDGMYQGKMCHGGNYFFLIRYMLPENGYGRPKIASGEIYLID
ncbi:MAG: PKD domain-containing protein [Bacteroidia bacterium]